MRCIYPLDNSHCRLDNAYIHSYHSNDSTTDCWGPYLQQHAGYFLVSLMRCISPLDNSHCRLDNAYIHSYHSYDSTTDCWVPYFQQHAGYFLSVPNEMHLSTRQFSLSTPQRLYPLVPLVRLDN